MTLTQFLDNFWAKIFNKPWSGLRLKVSIFLEVFEGSNHPLWVGGGICLVGVAPPWLLAGIPKNGGIDDKAHEKKVVFDFKNIHENVTFYFHCT